MADLKPIGTFPKNEASGGGLQDLDLGTLQKLVEWPKEMERFVEGGTEPTPAYVPVPEEPAEAQSEPETPAEPEPVVEPEQPEAATPEEPQAAAPAPPKEEYDPEILQAKLDEQEAILKKLESKLVGREAGERGYIKQLQGEIARLKAGTEQEPEYAPSETPVRQAPEPRRDGFAAWAVSKAIEEAGARFIQGHPDFQEMQAEILGHLQESGYDPKTVLMSNDPLEASREVTRSLEGAYWHVQAARRSKVVSELQAKRADSMRGVEKARQKAAISAPGRSAPPPTPKRSTKDLSIEELSERVKRLAERR